MIEFAMVSVVVRGGNYDGLLRCDAVEIWNQLLMTILTRVIDGGTDNIAFAISVYHSLQVLQRRRGRKTHKISTSKQSLMQRL
jgi:hypothetical protein